MSEGASPLLDRATVLTSLAVAIALGATSMSDIPLLQHLSPGTAPSGPAVRRVLDLASGTRLRDRIARARAKALRLDADSSQKSPIIQVKGTFHLH